jgi:photosystem II stability/assembly factor-like uncharacterized protein
MNPRSFREFRPLAAALLFVLPLASAAAQDAAPAPPTEAVEVMPLATDRSLMLDITEGNQRAIMVGERGHILVSESRSDWRQITDVPTRSTLTAVTALGDSVWAVGHDGVILHSPDGGLTWTLQRREVWTPPAADDLDRDPRFGAPLLDVLFVDADSGFAIGAYSQILRTADGGATWTPLQLSNTGSQNAADDVNADSAENDAGDAGQQDWMFSDEELALDEEDDPHLNGIVRTSSGLLFIVAERGSAFRSRDSGTTWERLSLPYDGSMFGIISLGDARLLAYGLRGNVLESRDDGESWESVETGTTLSLLGGAALPDGGAVVVGANGVVLHRIDADSPFSIGTYENANLETPILASVRPQGVRTFLVAGERGFGRYQIN